MASLTSCKDCGTEVSAKADACPKCGRARPGGGVSGTVVLATVLIAIALVAFMLWRASSNGVL
jgi:RNA polymerase subunit RPABC4/transcription elongation factor Spt4